MRVSATSALYEQMVSIDRFFIEKPELKGFVYHNEDIVLSDPNYRKVRSLAEMMADLMEHIYLQKNNLPEAVWLNWKAYMAELYKTSPILRQHFDENRDWYPAEMFEIISKNGQIKFHDGPHFGFESIFDIYECDYEILTSESELKKFVLSLAATIEMKTYGDPIMKRFGHGREDTLGYTVIQLIETSSITLHVSEAGRSVFLNVFSCIDFSHAKVKEFSEGFLRGKSLNDNRVIRG